MPFTFSAYLNNQPNRHGLHNIMIRALSSGQMKAAKTDYYIKPVHWNKAPKADAQGVVQYVKKSYYDYQNANTQIALRISKAREHVNKIELEQNRQPTLEEVCIVLEGGSPGDSLDNFPAWAEKQIIAEYGPGRKASRDGHLRALKSFTRFMGKKDYNIYDITHERLKSYQKWMIEKGKQPSTINQYIKAMAHVIRWARLDDHLPYNLDPFKRFTHLDEEEKTDHKNQEEDIFLLEQAVLTKPKHVLARDFQLCCYFLRGMRGSDLVLLKVGNVNFNTGRVKYTAMKTRRSKQKEFNVKIPPQAREILDKYCQGKKPHDFVFPFLTQQESSLPKDQLDQRINNHIVNMDYHLSVISRDIGLKRKLMTYSGRYAAADAVNRRFGELAVKEFFDHSNVKISQRYFNQDQQRIDKYTDEIY